MWSIRCRCGRTLTYSVDAEICEHQPLLLEVVTRAALGDGWLVYPQIPAWDCPACVEESACAANLYQWAIGARAKYLGQGWAP